ncbi:DUF1559 domain-containing protein [Novipirellula artificiosorum]|uniref:DUF1559 domain-containing protein n=1 Tax=Novipirellula artificiosorum TaxID=2528016 RepID=A0A5C6DW72_9BACT|nr:DUF1559 domain-containing protein [Novipirellula artificiosorum]TWU39651.1 hypothetical protein Poly41_25070 [Novipirellula artificiosorum]
MLLPQTRLLQRSAILSTCLLLTAVCSAQSNSSRSGVSKIGSEYIPTDAVVTVVMTVADTIANPVAEMYPIEVAEAWCKEHVGIVPSNVDRLKVVAGAPGPGGPMLAIIVSLRNDGSIDNVNANLLASKEPIDVDGHSAYRLRNPPDTAMMFQDARTLVIATDNYLDAVLRAASPESPNGPLAKMAAAVSHTGNVSMLMAVEPVRPLIKGALQSKADQVPPPLQEFTKIPDLLDAVLVQIDLANEVDGAKLIMLGRDDASAEQLSAILDRGLQMGRQIGLAQANQQLQGDDAVTEASRAYADRMADRILQLLTPERDGRKLTISGPATTGIATQGVLVGLLLPAVQAAREAARRTTSANHMKQLALAIHNHHSVYKRMPGTINDPNGKPLLSWRVEILPFLEHQALYERFHLDEAWDSPHNRELITEMPETFVNPRLSVEPGSTVYREPSGDEYVFSPGKEVRFRDIMDGTANTILLLETNAEHAAIWTQPDGLAIDPDNPMSFADGLPGFHACLADGSIRLLTNELDPKTFKAMLTKAGKEVVRF